MKIPESFSFLVQDIRQETNGARCYVFDYGLTPFEFYAGQFSVVTLPGSNPACTAAITLASSPLRRGAFEFVVVRTGNFGSRFYDSTKVGDLISMKPPQGKFQLEINDPRPVVCLAYDYCTTGFRAFWQYHQDVVMRKELVLIHPHRDRNNALFRADFETSTSPNRKYYPIEITSTTDIQTIISTLSFILNTLSDPLVYIAGEKYDVQSLTEDTQKCNILTTQIRTERWS